VKRETSAHQTPAHAGSAWIIDAAITKSDDIGTKAVWLRDEFHKVSSSYTRGNSAATLRGSDEYIL
jgi:hypothetical protein